MKLESFGDVEARHPELPWASLRPEAYPPSLMAQARRFWSENAYNEWASAQAMTRLVHALAQVPEELRALACDFPADERVHVELCVGVARRCGGLIEMSPQPYVPLESVTEEVVRVCCVGEAVSQPLLAGNLRAARQPLARAVLSRIVRDETRHARLGWQYLDWIAPRLDEGERRRLGVMVGAQLRQLEWSGDADVSDGGGLGWMSPAEWRRLARETVERALIAPLGDYGIVVA